MATDVRELIRTFLAENFLLSDEGFTLEDDVSLLDAGVVDSTSVLELVVFVEETFGFHIADQEVVPANLDSVSRIVGYIERKLEAQPA